MGVHLKLYILLAFCLSLAVTHSTSDSLRTLQGTQDVPLDVELDAWSWSSSADAQFIKVCMNMYSDDYYFCNVGN